MAAAAPRGAFLAGDLLATVQRAIATGSEKRLPALFEACDFSRLSQESANGYIDLVIGRIRRRRPWEDSDAPSAALVHNAAKPIFDRASPERREALEEALGDPALREAYRQTLSGANRPSLNPFAIREMSWEERREFLIGSTPEVQQQFLTACHSATRWIDAPTREFMAAALGTGHWEANWVLRFAGDPMFGLSRELDAFTSSFIARVHLRFTELNGIWQRPGFWGPLLQKIQGPMTLESQVLIWETVRSRQFYWLPEAQKNQVLQRLGIVQDPRDVDGLLQAVWKKLGLLRMERTKRAQKATGAAAAVALAALLVSPWLWIAAVALAGYGVHAWRNRLIPCEDEARRAEFMRRLEARPEAG